jgi:hypothetical protein
MKNNKIRYGQAEIIEEHKTGITLVKFNGRYYTCYGRMFAVAGNTVNTPYNEASQKQHYGFCDWNNHRNLYKES